MSSTNPIAAEFGKAAEYYHQHAEIPRKVAEGLIASLEPWKETLPPGPILEVGCGTGFLTKHLIKLLPKREFVITDASPKMLEFCKRHLKEEGLLSDNITFKLLDVNEAELEGKSFALVISNFVAHWFKDATMGLEDLSKAVKQGGLLLSSFPGEQSFTDWYENCLQLGLPHTANPLPNVERVATVLSLGPLQVDYYENDLSQDFNSAYEFFHHIKHTGMGYSRLKKSLSPKQLRLLINHWDSKANGIVRVKWHIIYIAAKRDW